MIAPERRTSEFDQAARRILQFLEQQVPLEFWTVSRVVDGRQVYLRVTDNPLGLGEGDGPIWTESLCETMWARSGPQIAPDVSDVPEYAHRGATKELGVACYVGVPIVAMDGSLFGTLCAVDTRTQSPSLAENRPLFDLIGDLLSSTLHAEERRLALEREVEVQRLAADTDPLTGLLNRRAWEIVCESEESRGRPLGDVSGVLLLDLDNLKQVNDTHGHAAGDEHLRTAAEVLRANVRDRDHAARIGGDEFAVLCPQTGSADVRRIAERLDGALIEAGVPASIGMALMDIHHSLDDAVREADRQLYAVKRQRRALHRGDAGG